MKIQKYVTTALEVLLDVTMKINSKQMQVMVADNDKEDEDGMTPEERRAIIIALIIAIIACSIVCYLRITNQIVCAPNTI